MTQNFKKHFKSILELTFISIFVNTIMENLFSIKKDFYLPGSSQIAFVFLISGIIHFSFFVLFPKIFRNKK